jgi:2-oxo-hept-3-ene-1,7-dioate hydratase
MMAPALEVVDYSRSAKSLSAILTHCTFHEGTVLGAQTGAREHPELGTRWPQVSRNGESARAARSDTVPADLGELVQTVARFLATYGQRLESGDLILSGAYTDPLPVASGDVVSADHGALGTVEVRVAAA